MEKIVKHYTNGEVTIVWKPDLCIHTAICISELPEVFNTKSRPWIIPENASTEKLIEVVNLCPSNALTFFSNNTNNNSSKSV